MSMGITIMGMSVAATCVCSVGMSMAVTVAMVWSVYMRVAVSSTSVWVTVSTSGVWVTMVTAAVLECKDADDVDDEAKNWDDEQTFMMDFWRLKQTLYTHSPSFLNNTVYHN